MGNVDTHFALHWAWGLIIGGAIILPLVLWRQRKTYLCVLCASAICVVFFAWIWDMNAADTMGFAYCEFPGRNFRLFDTHVHSMLGQMAFCHEVRYMPGEDSSIVPSDRRDRWVFYRLRSTKLDVTSIVYAVGPSRPLIYLHGGGFELLIEHDPPGSPFISYPRLWALVLPDWFIILLLAIYPMWRASHYRQTKWYRRRHFLCLQCGYSLLGLAAPIICPECGAPHNQAGTKLGTQTPAIAY